MKPELAALIEKLRHACSVATGDLLALGMPPGASTGTLLLEAVVAAEKQLAQMEPPKQTPDDYMTALVSGLVRGEGYTRDMRRDDYDAFVALVEKQRALHRQLEVVSQDLLTLGGKMQDHAAGFEHKPETCVTCATAKGQP